jgi:hypothetical protein
VTTAAFSSPAQTGVTPVQNFCIARPSIPSLTFAASYPLRSHTIVVVDVIDEDSFNVLYRETAEPLRAYAARVLGNTSQADGIVQKT